MHSKLPNYQFHRILYQQYFIEKCRFIHSKVKEKHSNKYILEQFRVYGAIFFSGDNAIQKLI